MEDRVPRNPGRVRLEPVAGETNVYDMTREDNPVVVGTAMSKSTFLKDTTAALYGLGEDAVPDEVLQFLSAPPNGLGGISFRFRTQDGKPIDGVVVSYQGGLSVSALSGFCTLELVGGPYDFTVIWPIGFTGTVTSVQKEAVSGKRELVDLIGAIDTSVERVLLQSTFIGTSVRVSSFDICAVGGGGSGGACAWHGDSRNIAFAASGGAGGHTANSFNLVPTGKVLKIIVGAGGEKATATNQKIAKGNAGGDTTVSVVDGTNVIAAAKGGDGGSATVTENATAGATGATGGSGAGGSSSTVGGTSVVSFCGASGDNGSDGAADAHSIAGGKGQGTTTKKFAESTGELFSGAGASAAAGYNIYGNILSAQAGSPGSGGGVGVAALSGTSVMATPGTEYGCGGGAAVIFSKGTTTTAFAGGGFQGAVFFRWRIAT